MPKGMNPNSLKALEENRHKGRKSHEKAVADGKKGGIQNGINASKRRTMREELEILLQGTVEQKDKNGKVIATMTRQEAINAALIAKAGKGDARAYEIIRDTLGQKPVEVIAIQEIDPAVVEDVQSILNEYADKT